MNKVFSIFYTIIGCILVTAWAAQEYALAFSAPPIQQKTVLPAAFTNTQNTKNLLHKVAIFGKDSRKSVPPSLRHKRKQIGLLFNRKNKTLCTAFCVAPSVIATASHCFFQNRRTSRNHLANFIFRLNGNTNHSVDTHLSGYKTNQVHHYISAGTTTLSKRPPIGAARDWSLVKLAKPSCKNNTIKVQPRSIVQLERASRKDQIFQIAYHQDYKNWNLAYSRSCQIKREFYNLTWSKITQQFKKPAELILHRCDTGVASSGSPILQKTKNGIVVIGINVGTYQQRNLLIKRGHVVKRSPFLTIANTAVNASAFSRLIPILETAEILTDPLDIIELQSNLKYQNYKITKADGIFGSQTEAAIKHYERHYQFPEIGLPTRKILNALRNVNIIQRGRASMSSSVSSKRKRKRR